MQTTLTAEFKNTPEGQEADAILRSCVHCGFCTATCPTYQLLGDELDGPRGRIYLIKQVLEGQPVTQKTQLHLDRCLTCRACETTCPSGVQYGRLADIGRAIVEQRVKRPLHQRLIRRLLRLALPYPDRFRLLLRPAQWVRPLLPTVLKRKIPAPQTSPGRWSEPRHTRRMLVLEGCVQSLATPITNHATARVLDKLGISLLRAPKAGCCGALSQHLSAQEEALNFMRRNIDAWWPDVESGIEAILVTASGCGTVVKDYGHLLTHDPQYREKAERISELAKDISEVLVNENLSKLTSHKNRKVAFQSPCTLQHGQKITKNVEQILTATGHTLTAVPNAHLCCGSAGTYSILQPQLSQRLLTDKLVALEGAQPDYIVSANVGCQLHLATRATIPVRHWIELLE